MPLFGNRMVVATANYKHIEEKKKEFFDRESRLGRWVTERKARKEKLRELQVLFKYLLSHFSNNKKTAKILKMTKKSLIIIFVTNRIFVID